jgi:penicillin-binding protein 2
LALIVGLVYLVLIGRAISIQVSNTSKYLSLAEKNRIREFSILPGRGLIYDRNGNVIVRNKPTFSIELNTLICTDACDTSISNVKKYLSLDDEARILSELAEKRTNILLATGVEKESVLTLEANIDEMPGVSIETAPARDYLYGDAFAHLLGYVGLGDTLTPTIVGKTGVEEFYDQYLSGVSGNKVVQVDSAGTKYSLITYKDPLPGKNVELFVDYGLQQKAYELLKQKIEEADSDADAGAIVAQNPIDGSILALVSYPSFDPNKLSSGISHEELERLNTDPTYPFYNRAISAAYPPGSTFKLVTASAVLMSKVADAYTTITDNGFIQVGSFIFRNWNTSGHGAVDMVRALQVSNDTYFYIMGGGYGGVGGLGIQRLSTWAKLLGYDALTGIDMNGEVPGYMPDGTTREWYLGDDYISAIGQGDILATPLQVNNMTTYFANGGYLFKPRIVKRIDGVGDTEVEVIAQNLIDKEDYDLIRRGVHLASSPGGTAYPLYDVPLKYGVEVAGKTGTSEYIDKDGTARTHAWYTMFAPYFESADDQARANPINDKPITITVFLEGGGGGSDDAAPLARELLGYWLEN